MKDDIRPTPRAKKVPAVSKTNTSHHRVAQLSEKPHHVPVADKSAPPAKIRLHKRVHWWLKSLSGKQLAVLAVVFLTFVGGSAYAIRHLSKDTVRVADSVSKVEPEPEPPKPTTVASRMTGLQVAPELNELPLTGVMIENSPDARPQSGLHQADMVIEAIAEGGITRFLAFFQESKPDYLGPVRSVRPYYLDFVVAYDAAIAHAGGSAVALAQIRTQGIKDLDHGPNAAAYQRVSNRFAPHNLYTSRAKLLEVHKKRGYNTSDYEGLARKEKEEPATTPTASTINFDISSFLYNPSFTYDAKSNAYKRSQAGKPHVDERSGKQISPKVVVALVMSYRKSGIYSVYGTSGSGKAFIFQDGVVTTATWSKSSRKGELMLKDAAGKPFPLNPGRTWISLVSSAGAVKYTP